MAGDDDDPTPPPRKSTSLDESDKSELENLAAGIVLVIGAGLLAAGGDAVAGDTGAVVGIVLAFVLAVVWVIYGARH
ncbi:hypothetical protein [Patulibacter sp.]|uniref:hypothetical protein n=1 Tax=Patulibacter sp. TaxID=1912859 RepID=UPI00272266E4|nr:hypothetical protein [Patulibacter sp.]MDO9409413.1 hypothetical protein [Patulibacter sp.]